MQLQQVLLNLVVNGMDAMSTVQEQERLLEIRGRPDVQDGMPAVTISVQDRGIGLRADTDGAALRGLLHDQAARHGHGAGDQPLDHRGARRPTVGRAESAAAARRSRSACPRRRTRPHA